MELISYHQLVMQGMYHLNAMMQLDVVWYASDQSRTHGFQSMDMPAILDFDIENEYPVIDTLCRKDGFLKYCVAASASFLEFVFIPLEFEGASQGLIRIGPFLTGPIPEKQLSAFLVSLSLPLSRIQALRSFFESLPLLLGDASKSLGHIGLNLFGKAVPRTHSCLYQSEALTSYRMEMYESTLEEDLTDTELRYEFQKSMMHTVATGNLEKLEEISDFMKNSSTLNIMAKRLPENPLRNTKNGVIIVNTMLRIAAEQGGLHPAYLHQISSKYARLIEQAMTRTAVLQIQDEMLRAYIEMVRKYAFPNVSPFIRKVLDNIMLNLNQPLSLAELAEKFSVQPSNLANQFKKEMGQTITDFINIRRINESQYYLKNTDMSVGDISQYMGISDANYFSRLFRKYKGMSPLQYRRSSLE